MKEIKFEEFVFVSLRTLETKGANLSSAEICYSRGEKLPQ